MRKGSVLLVGLMLLVAATPAHAGHAHGCGTVRDGKFRVFASNGVKCKFARKWTKRYLRSGSKPSGWSCSTPGGNVRFYCRRGEKFYYARRT